MDGYAYLVPDGGCCYIDYYWLTKREVIGIFGMVRMNKKGMEQFYLVLVIIAALFLVAASIAFIPNIIKMSNDFFEKIGFDFSDETKKAVIDEERIDTLEEIPIDDIEYDDKSGFTVIVKQGYGEGWNLEVQESFFDKQKKLYHGPGWLLTQFFSGGEPEPIIANKKLKEILDSEKLIGKIEIAGRTYIHTSLQNNFCWFGDDSDLIYNGEEYIDNNKNCQYEEGESFTDINNNKGYDYNNDELIGAEEFAEVIVSYLYYKALGES